MRDIFDQIVIPYVNLLLAHYPSSLPKMLNKWKSDTAISPTLFKKRESLG